MMVSEGRFWETAVQLYPGMEVTQVDWAGKGHAQVVWMKIDKVYSEDNLPLIQLNHFIKFR